MKNKTKSQINEIVNFLTQEIKIQIIDLSVSDLEKVKKQVIKNIQKF